MWARCTVRAMHLTALSPDAPPKELPAGPVQADPSDAATLVWIDLDRSEASELSRLVTQLPAPVARDLLDPPSAHRLRELGGYRWLSLLGVQEAANGPELADLDVVVGPGLIATIHAGEQPALRRFGTPTTWRHPFKAPLSAAALVLILDATTDAYDDLINRAEEEVPRLQDAHSDRRQRSNDLLRQGQRMVSIGRRLASQRDLFADLARLRASAAVEGPWWIVDRLETAIAAAQDAADYALAASWSVSGYSRRRWRDIGLPLVAAWVTLLTVGALLRVSGEVSNGGVDPILFAGVVLGFVTVLVLALLGSRRWN